ncbi:MAG: phosphoenolpyruvate--protein phosphotransferase [Alphaproteobacteria bacterium]|nr:phosphoenolpyruvate--protein phosphotransferase [Alphaproteobacteria bacterium]
MSPLKYSPSKEHPDWLSVPSIFEGVSLSKGVGMGYAFFHSANPSPDQTSVDLSLKQELSHEDEKTKLDQAFDALQKEINGLLLVNFHNSQSEPKKILEAYQLLVNDQGWKRRLFKEIDHGKSATQAVDRVLDTLKKQFSDDPFWQERLFDLDDISQRLLIYLKQEKYAQNTDPSIPIIVIAQNLGPAALLKYHQRNLKGVVLAETGRTSHSAIIARSLGIPVVGGIDAISSKIHSTDSILVNGDIGRVYIRPAENIIRALDKKKARHIPNGANSSPGSSTTLDGIQIELHLNANLSEDLRHLDDGIAQGVGLYRTEIPFMLSDGIPSVETQTRFYQQTLDLAGTKPVVFRTLDVGEGKRSILAQSNKTNKSPSKNWRGWRDIRLTLDRPMIMRQQLRALIRARCQSQHPEDPLYLMVPMIADLAEFMAVRHLVALETKREQKLGNPVPESIKVGAMIEVPALVYQLSSLVKVVDFLSIGSNDLFQFFYAIERENTDLSRRFDVLSPSFLLFIKSIQDQVSPYQIPLSMCGEMASHPLEAMAVLGLGLRRLSVTPGSLESVQAMIRSLNVQKFMPYLLSICQQTPSDFINRPFGLASSIRQKLGIFAMDHGIIV